MQIFRPQFSALCSALTHAILPQLARAQTGCTDSPENPTAVLALVGGGGAVLGGAGADEGAAGVIIAGRA
jgi:XrtJ-associated TM-motif-TM protein